jgi:hypothetical protein
LFGWAEGPHRPERASHGLVALFNSPLKLTLDDLRAHLDAIYPGQFLPPRDRGNFAVDGQMRGTQFMIQSNLPAAGGLFVLQNVQTPYTQLSSYAEHIEDWALRDMAEKQSCWLSVELLRHYTSEDDSYRFIGSVIARLAPRDTAALVHPANLTTIAFTAHVRRELSSGGQPFGTA